MPADPDLVTILVHADAALRRKQDALDALDRRRPDHHSIPPEVAVGEASQGVVSLFLAAEAATRFCKRYSTPGPLGATRLAALLNSTSHLRPAVMHWDDKGQRAETTLLVNGKGVAAVAPPRQSRTSVVDGVTWNEYEIATDGLLRWARHMQELPAERV
ncbi:MAG: hypothetical protein K0S97_2275 [Chloroflexota bacterium]|jgi:hypothetical protein|nr:hypothetical protein [Chloroflexota bacterium]